MKTIKAISPYLICLILKTFCFSQRIDNLQVDFIKNNYKLEKGKIDKIKAANRNIKESIDLKSPYSLYRHGINLITNAENFEDTLNAINWITKSANLDYAPALYKLGVYHKYGIGVIKDLNKSFTLFDLSAVKGNINGRYSRGYMYYKGLGCNQDYNKAFLDFEKCASDGNPSCMYMLGLCYRNGFGTQINVSEASKWLQLAIKNGYTNALLEMSYELPEINDDVLEKIKSCNEINIIRESSSFKQNEFNRIQDKISHKFNNNLFEGYLVKYDYSGNNIVKIDKFEVTSNINDEIVTLNFDNESDAINIEGTLSNNLLQVKSEGILRGDRYILNTNDTWILNSIRFDEHFINNQNFLVGVISSYSTYEQEEDRPSKIFLFDKNKETLVLRSDLKNINFQANPNPFIDELKVSFDLFRKSICRLTLLDISGKLYFDSSEQTLESGNYIFPINLQLKSGIYIITLQTDNNFNHLKTIKI